MSRVFAPDDDLAEVRAWLIARGLGHVDALTVATVDEHADGYEVSVHMRDEYGRPRRHPDGTPVLWTNIYPKETP